MKRRDPVTEVLIKARERITDRRRWQRHALASEGPNTGRLVCAPGDPRAVRWCAVGALEAELTTARPGPKGGRFTLNEPLYAHAMSRLQQVGDVMRTNDRLGHAAVLALFDAAIRQK
jgi:hypothetical protein